VGGNKVGDILSGNAYDGRASKNSVKTLSFRMPFH
jgi:hypothetical protein